MTYRRRYDWLYSGRHAIVFSAKALRLGNSDCFGHFVEALHSERLDGIFSGKTDWMSGVGTINIEPGLSLARGHTVTMVPNA